MGQITAPRAGGGLFGRIMAGVGPRQRSDSFDTGAAVIGLSAPSATGVLVNQQSALQVTAVMACVRLLAEDVSKMPPRLYRMRDGGGRDEITQGPLADLLWQPNRWQTWPEFCRQMTVAYLLRGNAMAPIFSDGRGQPTMMWPVNPDRMALWESPDGALFWWFTPASLFERALFGGRPMLIPYDEVFHLKDLSANGLVGQSPIALAREAIGLALGQEQQQAKMIGNGARPSGILTTDQKLTDATAEALKQRWREAYTGAANTGAVPVLEGGLKWQQLSLTAVDMQFLQARQFSLEEICRIFRVPPTMVGHTIGRGQNQSLPQQMQDYRNGPLTSHSDVWERRFDMQFGLRKQGMVVDFDESSLLKADLAARYDAYRIGRFGGWLTGNEIRLSEGLNPVDGADELWEPTNMQPVQNAGDVAGSADTGEAPTGAGSTPAVPPQPDQAPQD